MLIRSVRRLVAQVAIVGIAFACVVASVHACQLGDKHIVAAAVDGTAGGNGAAAPCTDMDPLPANPLTTACETHRSAGIAGSAQSDPPPLMLAALPAAAPALAELATPKVGICAPIVPLSGAPPLALRYCRLRH